MDNKKFECFSVRDSKLKREKIIGRLREKGYRVTKQRKLIIDVVLKGDCTCCKEVYCEVKKKYSTIGKATVYRMINDLELIGILENRRIYGLDSKQFDLLELEPILIVKGSREISISNETWKKVLEIGFRSLEEINMDRLESIMVKV